MWTPDVQGVVAVTALDERPGTQRSKLADELYGYVPPQYRVALDIMLALVPPARAHFEVGNVVMATRLLNAASTVRVGKTYEMTKELMLTYVLQAMPVTYQTDLDPEFAPDM